MSSKLFAQFLIMHGAGGDPPPRVRASCLGYIYEALTTPKRAQEPARDEPIVRTTLDVDATGLATIRDDANNMLLQVVPDGAIGFPTRLADASISGDYDITFGTAGGHFLLGPATSVECRTLKIACRDLHVNAQPEKLNVELISDNLQSNYDLRVDVHKPKVDEPERFVIRTNATPPGLSAYSGERIARGGLQSLAGREETDALIVFLRVFRGDPTRKESSVLDRRWSAHQKAKRWPQTLLERALHHGVVTQRDTQQGRMEYTMDNAKFVTALVADWAPWSKLDGNAKSFVREFADVPAQVDHQ